MRRYPCPFFSGFLAILLLYLLLSHASTDGIKPLTQPILTRFHQEGNFGMISLGDAEKHRYTNKRRTYQQYPLNRDSTEVNLVLSKCAHPR